MTYKVTIFLETRHWDDDHPAWTVWDKNAEPFLAVNAVDSDEAFRKAKESLDNNGVRAIKIEKDVDVQALRDQQHRDHTAAKNASGGPRALTGLEAEEAAAERKAERESAGHRAKPSG